MGSTLAARRAGTKPAASADIVNITTAMATLPGSNGCIPYSNAAAKQPVKLARGAETAWRGGAAHHDGALAFIFASTLWLARASGACATLVA